MKSPTTLILLTLSAVSLSHSQSASLPPDAVSLKKSYHSAIAKANEPITKTYLAELERLKTEYTKKAQLADAVAIEAEINRVRAIELASATANDPVLGRWQWNRGQVVEIRADGTAGDGGLWKAIPDPGGETQYEIRWENGKVVDLFSLSRDGKKLFGKNSRGERIEVRRVEE